MIFRRDHFKEGKRYIVIKSDGDTQGIKFVETLQAALEEAKDPYASPIIYELKRSLDASEFPTQ